MPIVPHHQVTSGGRLITIAALIAVGVFVADLNLPFDVAISALYGIVVLLGLFAKDPRFALIASAAVTVLTVVGGWLSPAGGPVAYGIANRGFVLIGIWVSAWLVAGYARVRRELDRSQERLREQAALARLGEMAAVVAHEVKNPLAGIRGVLQIFGSRLARGDADRAVLEDVIARLDSLNNIVQDLLVFARPRDPKLGPVLLDSLLLGTAALLKKDPAHASTQVDLTGTHVLITADAVLLQIVLMNLLVNASQATAGEGRVRVTVTTTDRLCRIAVADNGPGIPPAVRDQIFEPFFTTKTRGTGLGLPTAKRVVERHNGTIEIDCPPNGGTVVTVLLPLEPRHQPMASG